MCSSPLLCASALLRLHSHNLCRTRDSIEVVAIHTYGEHQIIDACSNLCCKLCNHVASDKHIMHHRLRGAPLTISYAKSILGKLVKPTCEVVDAAKQLKALLPKQEAPTS